jgi:hypothetical protein
VNLSAQRFFAAFFAGFAAFAGAFFAAGFAAFAGAFFAAGFAAFAGAFFAGAFFAAAFFAVAMVEFPSRSWLKARGNVSSPGQCGC